MVKEWLDSTRRPPFVCCKVEVVYSCLACEGNSVSEWPLKDGAFLFTFNILTHVSQWREEKWTEILFTVLL